MTEQSNALVWEGQRFVTPGPYQPGVGGRVECRVLAVENHQALVRTDLDDGGIYDRWLDFSTLTGPSWEPLP